MIYAAIKKKLQDMPKTQSEEIKQSSEPDSDMIQMLELSEI